MCRSYLLFFLFKEFCLAGNDQVFQSSNRGTLLLDFHLYLGRVLAKLLPNVSTINIFKLFETLTTRVLLFNFDNGAVTIQKR